MQQPNPESVRGWFTRSEGATARRFASIVRPPNVIVEVGSFQGKSTCYLGLGSLEGYGAKIFAVDLWTTHPARFYRRKEHGRAFRTNIDRFGLSDTVTAIRGKSVDVAKSWDRGTIGLLHIDGCHETAAVLNDYRYWSMHLDRDAIILFHDYDMRRVRKAVDSLNLEKIEVVDSLYVARVFKN